jgi:ABC-2 type transport system permease protein
MKNMQKYLRTFLLALQSQLTSLANLFGWLLVMSVPSAAFVLVWLAILGERESINGFTKGDFIVYYTFVTFAWYIAGGAFARTIGNGIKNGIINTTLLKPYNVILRLGIEEQAWKALSIFVALPATGAVLYAFRDIININLEGFQIALLVISLIFGGLIFALIEAITGLSAFWITDAWPIIHTVRIFLELFSGRLVPLTFMPPTLLIMANILPFKYIFYVPTSILLNKSQHVILEISIQFLFVVILFGLYKIIWRFGIRKYEAIGV